MKASMHVLAIGSGILDDTGTYWANIHVLDNNLVVFDDGKRQEKGVKVAKVKLTSDNQNAVAKRFFNETFPADFILDIDTSVTKNGMSITVTNFTSNIK